MLHEGRFIPHQGGYTRVLFIEPGAGTLVAHNNVMDDALNIDVNIFVRDMVESAICLAWSRPSDPRVQSQLSALHVPQPPKSARLRRLSAYSFRRSKKPPRDLRIRSAGTGPVVGAVVAPFPVRVDRAHEVEVRGRGHGEIGSSWSSDTPRSLSAWSLWAYPLK